VDAVPVVIYVHLAPMLPQYSDQSFQHHYPLMAQHQHLVVSAALVVARPVIPCHFQEVLVAVVVVAA